MLFVIGLALTFIACGGSKGLESSDAGQELLSIFTGSFSSENQAEEDSVYMETELHISSIWKERKGDWFYVEQVEVAQPEEPMRQSVYRIVPLSSDRFKILKYKFRNPQVFAGQWKSPEFFNDYPEDVVALKEGCGVYLHRKAYKNFEGETFGEDCFSQREGTAYATSKIEVRNDVIRIWERGWSAEGEQVWGPKDGHYRFERIESNKEEIQYNP
jgi:hypothetical protein